MPSEDIGQLAESGNKCRGRQSKGGGDPIELVEFIFTSLNVHP